MKFRKTIEVVRTFVHEVEADSPEQAEEMFEREQYDIIDENVKVHVVVEPYNR